MYDLLCHLLVNSIILPFFAAMKDFESQDRVDTVDKAVAGDVHYIIALIVCDH